MKLCLLLLLLVSCTATKKQTIEGIVFCMPFSLKFSNKKEQTESVKQALEDVFCKIDQEINHFNGQSILAKCNSAHESEPIIVTPLILELLEEAKQMYTLTNGKFDPTMQDFTSIKIVNNKIVKSKKDLKLNLTAMAKGKALDMIAQRLNNLGIKDYIVNWAGEIICASSTKPYHILLKNSSHTIPIKEGALATSGGKELSIDDNTHFIDTKTTEPIKLQHTLFESITVVAKSCSLCDALATSACLFTKKEALFSWIQKVKETKECRFYLLNKDKTLIVQ